MADRRVIHIYNMEVSQHGRPSILCVKHIERVKSALLKSDSPCVVQELGYSKRPCDECPDAR